MLRHCTKDKGCKDKGPHKIHEIKLKKKERKKVKRSLDR